MVNKSGIQSRAFFSLNFVVTVTVFRRQTLKCADKQEDGNLLLTLEVWLRTSQLSLSVGPPLGSGLLENLTHVSFWWGFFSWDAWRLKPSFSPPPAETSKWHICLKQNAFKTFSDGVQVIFCFGHQLQVAKYCG